MSFGEVLLSDGKDEPVYGHPGQYPHCHGEDVSLIGTVGFVFFIFVEGDNDCISEVLWYLANLPAGSEQRSESFDFVTGSFTHTYSGTPPMPGAFTGYNLATATLICSSGSGLFSSSLTH